MLEGFNLPTYQPKGLIMQLSHMSDRIDNYRIDGMPEHAETEFLRYGADHLMELVKDAQPSD